MKVKSKVPDYYGASSDAIDLALSSHRDALYDQKHNETGDKPEVDYLEVELEESLLQKIGTPKRIYFAKHLPNVLIGKLGQTSQFELTSVKYYYQDA